MLGGAATWPLAARAQQAIPLIGFMSGRAPETDTHLVAAFRQGLREQGFVEAETVAIEFRWARGEYDRLPELAAELVALRVAVLAALGGDVSGTAAKQATSTIPIVFGSGGDPVKTGLVESFGRPGGNATGYTLLTNEMESKRVGLLHELIPGLNLFGALINPHFAPTARQFQQIEEATRTIGLNVLVAKRQQRCRAR
jgi:putative ABC transport system substrate-binding protein